MKPTVPEVLPLVDAYYAMPGNEVGGSLHIVLDDQNLDDSSVDFCIQWAVEQGDAEGEKLGRTLRLMSKTQRKKLAKSKTRTFF